MPRPRPSSDARRRPERRAGIVVSAALALAASGCGYRLAAAGGLERAVAGRPVTVEVFENRTVEADAGFIAARAAGRAIAPRLGTPAAGAPLRLGGTVQTLSSLPVAYDGAGAVSLWRVQARLGLVLREADGAVVASSVVEGAVDTPAGADAESTEVSRRLALARLLEQLVDEGLDRLAPAP